MPPTLIMCAGGNQRFAESAVYHGWHYGAQLPCTTYAPVWFADQNWKKPDRQRYMAALAQHRPAMATVLDLETRDQLHEVLDWAEEAAQYVACVIIIPKISGIIELLPRRIGDADVILGYSVPTKFGGTCVPIWEFGDWPVHLLGGSPQKQMTLWHYMDVVSADGNMASKMATSRASFWRQKKGSKGHWVNLREIGWGDEHDAPYTAFDLSMRNIMAAWQGRKGE
jgi:hypothetical protein